MRTRTIDYDVYLDKVLGCWIGKSLGGIIGAPYESHKIFGKITAEECWPKKIYPNDDLDIQVVWLEMLEEIGPRFSREHLVQYWQDRCWYNFAEYGSFLYNEQRGIHTPLSGRFNNRFYRESQGCPIRSEIWGAISPGSPDVAARFAKMDGELDHVDNSVWAEQFWAVCLSESFFTADIDEILEKAISYIPADCEIAKIYHEVLRIYSSYEGRIPCIWKQLVKAYGHRDASKVSINFAFSLLALVDGDGDLKKTIVTAINLGWDSDCTAATAGAIVGAILGSAEIPEDWSDRMGLYLTCDVNVRHKNSSLQDFAADTCVIGIETLDAFCPNVKITNIPAEIYDRVRKNQSLRQNFPLVSFDIVYQGEPVLLNNEIAKVSLIINYSGKDQADSAFEIIYPEGVEGSVKSGNILLIPGTSNEIVINIKRNPESKILWDKNIINIILEVDNTNYRWSFGLVGARQWKIYGPFWDAWDKDRFGDVCPYRNDELVSHPIHIEGCQYMQEHEYVSLNHVYEDEINLINGLNITSDNLRVVESGEDVLTENDYSGFFGEACFIFVRNFISREAVDCMMNIGCSGIFSVYINGKEVLRREQIQGWAARDFQAEFQCDGIKPVQVIIKAVRPGDNMSLSICFIKKDVPGDKLKGISYFVDSMGEVL